MLLENFRISPAIKVLLVGVLAGVSGFMFTPLVLSTSLSYYMASFGGIVITCPLILYFLRVPEESFDFSGYWDERGLGGSAIDFILTGLLTLAPGVVTLYGLLGFSFVSPVPVASSSAVGIFTGYSAFLFRNRKFYRDSHIDINL
jgi:hypothetical protein